MIFHRHQVITLTNIFLIFFVTFALFPSIHPSPLTKSSMGLIYVEQSTDWLIDPQQTRTCVFLQNIRDLYVEITLLILNNSFHEMSMLTFGPFHFSSVFVFIRMAVNLHHTSITQWIKCHRVTFESVIVYSQLSSLCLRIGSFLKDKRYIYHSFHVPINSDGNKEVLFLLK